MARDILAIPLSTIASESGFMGGECLMHIAAHLGQKQLNP